MSRSRSPRPPVEKRALTMKEFSEAYGISTEYIRLITRAGDITPSFVGRSPRYPVEEVERWFKSLPQEPVKSA